MAIITFWNDGKAETGQSVSMAAIATTLAINYDYKILMINTKYNDNSLENAFEPKNNFNTMFSKGKMDLDTGLSGVVKAIKSNKTSPEIITNYTKIILKNLELLTEKKVPKAEFETYMQYLKDVIKLANKHFDIVLVDLEGELENHQIKQILEISSVKVITIAQNINVIDNYVLQKEREPLLREFNEMILIGKYDEKSKYTIKNVSKYIKEKNVYGIPYNTMFSVDSAEGKIADYLIRFRKIRPNHVNAKFMEAINNETENIMRMVKDTQRKIY